MCFEVPALVPPGGAANGKQNGSYDDDANDDDLGIMDIDDNDSKGGKFFWRCNIFPFECMQYEKYGILYCFSEINFKLPYANKIALLSR